VSTTSAQPDLLLVADDLMVPSRVKEGAKPLGYAVRVAPTETAALHSAVDSPPVAILVNLTARRYDPLSVIAALKRDDRTRSIPLLAFAGHVEREKHEAAREAGADMVAANSSVSLHLGALLNRLLNATPENETDDALQISENE
jgi:CheY-like chemotaxis protein